MEDKNLLMAFPEIAKEWDYEKNNGLLPEMFAPYSNKIVSWKCQYGHEWKTKITTRTNKKSNCPFCAGQKPIQGVTDLNTVCPELAAEWHPYFNGDIMPNMVSIGSTKKIWWMCKKGHEWQCSVNNRSRLKNGIRQIRKCPYCSGKRIIIGENDLKSVNPTLAEEWDYEKNGDLTPEMVSGSCNKYVHWKCQYGHEWIANINNRNRRGDRCPYCTGTYPIVGVNDLLTTHPGLAAEWSYESNLNLNPSNVTSQSNKLVWWKCSTCGNEWKAYIYNRTKENATGCPYCSGRFPIKGKNDLQTLNPHLAAEWDYSENKGLTPEMVSIYSNKRCHWECKEGHKWTETVIFRSKTGAKCPYCSGRLPIIGKTDLKTLYPELYDELHPSKNRLLNVNYIIPTSNKKVWWECSVCGHAWRTSLYNRTKAGTGCPKCRGYKK